MSSTFQTGPNQYQREQAAEEQRQRADQAEFERRQAELAERRAMAAIRAPRPDGSAVLRLKGEQDRLTAEIVYRDQQARVKVSKCVSVDKLTTAQKEHEAVRVEHQNLEGEKLRMKRTMEHNLAEIVRLTELHELALFERDRLVKRLAANLDDETRDTLLTEMVSVLVTLGRLENDEALFAEAEKIRADLRERDPYWYAPDYIYRNADGGFVLEAEIKNPGARTFLGKGSRIEKSEAARLGLRDLFKEAK